MPTEDRKARGQAIFGARSARKNYPLAPLGRELERGALTLVLNETTTKRVLGQ